MTVGITGFYPGNFSGALTNGALSQYVEDNSLFMNPYGMPGCYPGMMAPDPISRS